MIPRTKLTSRRSQTRHDSGGQDTSSPANFMPKLRQEFLSFDALSIIYLYPLYTAALFPPSNLIQSSLEPQSCSRSPRKRRYALLYSLKHTPILISSPGAYQQDHGHFTDSHALVRKTSLLQLALALAILICPAAISPSSYIWVCHSITLPISMARS